MSPKTRPSDADWEDQKETIRKLYLDQDLTRQEVQVEMKSLGFGATKSQYEAKFKEWGFHKNIPVNTWKHIGYKVAKRKREKKDSVVYINGVKIPPKRVKKETSRHFYTSTDRVQIEKNNAPSPPGPPTVVATPPTSHEATESDRWPADLPWYSFIKLLDTCLEGIPWLQPNSQTVPDWLRASMQKETQENHGLRRQESRASNGYTTSGINHAVLPSELQSDGAVGPDPSMPPESASSSHWGLKLLVYLASNKLLEDFDIGVIWNLIEETDMRNLGSFSNLSYTTDQSLAAAMEYLFEAAINQRHVETMSWLLDIGMEANQKIQLWGEKNLHLPLMAQLFLDERARVTNSRRKVDMVRLLLSKGASPVLSCCDNHGSPVQFLLLRRVKGFQGLERLALFEAFLEATKTLNHHPKSQRTRSFDLEDATCDQVPPPDLAGDEEFHKMDQLVGLVEEFAVKTSRPSVSLISPKNLIKAVKRNNLQFVRVMHKHGLSMDCCDDAWRFPLQAAVSMPSVCDRSVVDCIDLNTVRLLLKLGASPNYDPGHNGTSSCSRSLQAAVLSPASRADKIDAIRILVQHGALPQGNPNCGEKHHHTLMDCAFGETHWYPCDLMLVILTLHDAGLPLPKSSLVTVLAKANTRGGGQKERDRYVGLLRSMSEKPLDFSHQAENGWTALDYARLMHEHWLEQLLVEKGARDTRKSAETTSTSRAPTTLSMSQSRKLIFDQLALYLRALDPSDKGAEKVSTLLLDYCRWPRSPKHDEYIISTACRTKETKVIKIILEKLPSTYSSEALRTLIRSRNEKHQWSFFEELLRRRRGASVDWSRDIRMFKQAVLRALDANGDRRVLQWFHKNDKKAFDCANLYPSTFAISVFGLEASRVHWHDPDVTQWFNCGLKASSYLGLLVTYAGQVEKIGTLLQQGFQPNRRICWSLTALQFAVARADKPLTLRLLAAGCDVNARPPLCDIPDSVFPFIPHEIKGVLTSHNQQTRRRTALQLATENGDLSIVRLLLEYEADVNAPAGRVGGVTALQIACIKGFIEIARLLISKKANINAPGAQYFGRTALEGAAEHGRLDIACLLLERDCRVDGPFRGQYIRAIGLARAQGHHILSKWLQESGQWGEEDELQLKQTDLRDKAPESRDFEENVKEDEEISEVDTDEFESEPDDTIHDYIDNGNDSDTYDSDSEDYESSSEYYYSTGEEGDSSRLVSHASQEAANISNKSGQSVVSQEVEHIDWDECLDYDADEDEEIF